VPVPAEYVPLDRGRLQRLATLLYRAAEVEAHYTGEDPVWTGQPGSVAQRDRAWTQPGVDPAETRRAVDTTYAAARLGLVSAVDQTRALALLVTEPEPGPYGHLGIEVVARSAVEIAARSWWLLESGIGPAERVGRYLADQLFSAYEAERLARAMAWPHGVSGISPESAQLRLKCDELRLPYTRSSKAPAVAGQQRPLSTDLIPRLIRDTIYAPSAEMVYRLTSATTHGTHYALMRSYRDTGDRVNDEPVYVRHIDHRQVEPVAGVALSAIIASLQRATRLAGWGRIRVEMYEHSLNRFLWSMTY